MYLIKFNNQEVVVSSNELLNFIQKAVIQNKDISTLVIDRIIKVEYTTASNSKQFRSVNADSWLSDF